MALSADRNYRTSGLTEVLHAKLTASLTVFKGSIVALASGLVVKAADTAGYTPFGVMKAGCVSASGENPDVEVETGKIWLPLATAAQTDYGKYVYASDDGTITTTALTNANQCGLCVGVVVGVELLVDFRMRLPKTALA